MAMNDRARLKASKFDAVHDQMLAANAEVTRLKARVKILEAAIRKECRKFRFPDEDRPRLYAALRRKA